MLFQGENYSRVKSHLQGSSAPEIPREVVDRTDEFRRLGEALLVGLLVVKIRHRYGGFLSRRGTRGRELLGLFRSEAD